MAQREIGFHSANVEFSDLSSLRHNLTLTTYRCLCLSINLRGIDCEITVKNNMTETVDMTLQTAVISMDDHITTVYVLPTVCARNRPRHGILSYFCHRQNDLLN